MRFKVKQSYLRLGFISLFAFALAACGGSSSSAPDRSSPDDNSDEKETPVTPPSPDLGGGFESEEDDTKVEGGNGSSVGGVPEIPSQPQVNNCPVPADTGVNTTQLLSNTSNKEFYNIENYTEDNTGSDLAGTWIITVNADTQSPELSSLNMQRYAFVIKEDNGKYQAANCSGLAVKTVESKEVCIKYDGKKNHNVSCDTPGAQRKPDLVTKEEYQPWADFIDVTLKDNKITLPLYLPSLFQPEEGIAFTLADSSFSRMRSQSGEYQAVKISNKTSSLGTSSIDIRGDKITTNADVSCVVHTKVVVQNCSGKEKITNTIAAILAATDKDLHQIATADNDDAIDTFMLLKNYVVTGDKLKNPTSVGRFNRHSTAKTKTGAATTASVTNDETELDITIEIEATDITSAQTSSIKMDIDLDRP